MCLLLAVCISKLTWLPALVLGNEWLGLSSFCIALWSSVVCLDLPQSPPIQFCWQLTRVSIAVTFTMYILAGREIFAKRQQLRSFSHPSPTPTRSTSMVANPFVSFKTTEVRITSELVGLPAANSSQTSLHLDSKERIKSSHGYDQYSVTVETRPMSPGLEQPTRPPPTPGAQSMYNKHNNAAMEANTAAWAYTKTALLFFASLLITWVRLVHLFRRRSRILKRPSTDVDTMNRSLPL